MSAVDDGGSPPAPVCVKKERECDDQDAGDEAALNVVVGNELKMEVEVSPEQLQLGNALGVKEERESADEDAGDLVMDVKSEELEVGPEVLQPQDIASPTQSGRKLEVDGKPAKSSKRTKRNGAKRSSRKKCHIYCSVYGCFTNDLENPEASFFQIPVELGRRIKWLQLIMREDLKDKPNKINRVCEIHFDPQDIRKSIRKTLKNNCLPCLNLPSRLKDDKQTQTNVETAVSSNQTDQTAGNSTASQTDLRVGWVSDNETQTAAFLSEDTPRIRKLKAELRDLRKRLKAFEQEQTGI